MEIIKSTTTGLQRHRTPTPVRAAAPLGRLLCLFLFVLLRVDLQPLFYTAHRSPPLPPSPSFHPPRQLTIPFRSDSSRHTSILSSTTAVPGHQSACRSAGAA